MNNQEELQTQCEAFRQSLERACHADTPLNDDFVRRFNGFLAKNPHVLEWKNEQGQQTLLRALHRYLVRAIRRKDRLASLQALVIQTPQVLGEKDRYGYTLLHFVCWFNPNALDIVSSFAQQNPDPAQALNDWKRTPLHFACREKASLPVIRVLVDACPRAIKICDTDGSTPLHFTCFYGAPLDVIQYLAMQKPHLCLRRCNYGTLPLVGAQVRKRKDRDDVIEFMTTAITAAARVLMKQLRFDGLLPWEIFVSVVAYRYGGGPMEGVSVVDSALSPIENDVLFRREEIQAEFRHEIGIDFPA